MGFVLLIFFSFLCCVGSDVLLFICLSFVCHVVVSLFVIYGIECPSCIIYIFYIATVSVLQIGTQLRYIQILEFNDCVCGFWVTDIKKEDVV